ncbi:MAG TPA: LCP family protein [Jatrophihabitantaceae bacterium]|nr:LCP family protein [Jatrophihabitantaceae bacterium]
MPVSYPVRVGVRGLFASISLVVLLGSGIAWVTFKNFNADVPRGEPVPALGAGEHDPDGSAQNILLIGNDTRAGATAAELKALHTGHDKSTANADTMMVLHVPSGNGRPTLVSFPRDSWVTIPGHGRGKINSAYPDGYNAAKSAGRGEKAAQSAGIVLTIKTIHALTGLYIDHYMQVNLLGFYRISEAIGGVTVCLNAAQNASTDRDAFGSGYSGINLPAGVSVIKGVQALAFVRQRHGLPHGDLDRIKRQQYFLKSAFQKMTSGGTLLNPFKLHDMLNAVGSSLLVDPKLDLLSLARQFESLTSGKITFATIPNNGAQLIYPDGVETSIVQVNRSAIPAFVAGLDGKGNDAYAKASPAAPASVTMDVLNGTDIPRLASRNAAQLRALGVTVNTVDSASATQTTVVEYPAGRESQAKAIVRLVPQSHAALTPGVTRVTLVLGADGHWVRGIARPATSTSGAKAKKADPTHGLGCID